MTGYATSMPGLRLGLYAGCTLQCSALRLPSPFDSTETFSSSADDGVSGW
jgi:hypothetical protein